ncbi:MAG: hypothetical protein HY659_14100 [Rhizobiales bacterium]|nr:hypothetical protein [Hyphomicrobiales bacterium]
MGALWLTFTTSVILIASAISAFAQQTCTRSGNAITCADGRIGVWTGDAIVWLDGTRSSIAGHPSVIIGHKSSVHIGPGVYVGQGKGVAPLDDPNKKPCVVLDGVAYCN